MLKIMRHPLILESNYPQYDSEEAAMKDFGPGGQYYFAGSEGVDPALLRRGLLPKRYWWQATTRKQQREMMGVTEDDLSMSERASTNKMPKMPPKAEAMGSY